MKKIEKNHPLAVRWFHWINFPVLGVMIWSGLLIYWGNDIYRLGWGDTTVLKFFPDSFNKALNIPFRLADGMALHFVFMWFFAINGLLYVLYTIFSGEWRYLVPGRKSFEEAWQVLLHDLHISKYEPPKTKYNSAQKIAYTSIIVMGLGSLLTGLAIYKPVRFGWITWFIGGYEWARAEHFMLTIGYVLFFLVHVGQVVKTGWNNFQSMVTGFEVKKIVPDLAVANATPENTPYIAVEEGNEAANEVIHIATSERESDEIVPAEGITRESIKAVDKPEADAKPDIETSEEAQPNIPGAPADEEAGDATKEI